MDKIKSFAPLLSVVLVGVCIVVSLSGYEAPVYARELQLANIQKTDEQEEEQEEAAEGSFDLEDGVYRGTGTGYAGSITVAVEIKSKTIVSIEVLSVEADDAAFVNRAKGVIDKIIEAQSLDVDVVSGATYSSNGIISAVKNALTGETDSGETADSSEGTAAAGSSTTVDTVEDAAAYKDGTYYGTGTGFRGSLTVKVVISGGKITSIVVTESSDDSAYLNKATSLINNIISSQSTNVDTVSGATYSSVGIIQAVRNALSKAAVSTTATTTQSTDDTNTQSSSDSTSESGNVPYVDGIYYGTAEGYAGDITVAVVIQDYTIKAILVTESEDDEEFFDRAMAVVKNVIKNQNTDVDLVSGATYSSTGLLEAIKNALKEAEKATNGTSEDDKTDDTDKDNNNQDGDDNTNNDDENNGDDNTDNDNNDEDKDTVYDDDIYSISVVCLPDEYEDFEAYNLTLKVTIRDDKIVAITDIAGDGDSSNDTYIKRAANGTSSITGVVAQIIESGTPENIDTVSRATCTSNSIIEACVKALENAKK